MKPCKTFITSLVPVLFIAGLLLSPVRSIAGDDLILWGWGDGSFGAVGDGSTSNKSKPVRVTALANIQAIRTGASHTMATGPSGSLHGWGSNQYGQLGDGTKNSKQNAVKVEGLSDVIAFSCGAEHTIALKANGTVWTWGRNSSGQLGIGAPGDRKNATKIQTLSDIVAVRAGAGHSLALDRAGRVWAWGDNRYGQLGPSGPPGYGDAPVQVAGLGVVTAIEAGGRHNLAMDSEGKVWAWGDNLFGQLGAATAESYSAEPVLVAGIADPLSVRAGYEHNIALLQGGGVWAWGANFEGQLGDGTTSGRFEPRRVQGIENVTDISAGRAHNLALQENQTLWSWGANGYGQLGDGTLEDKKAPLQIGDISAVEGIRAGWDRSFAFSVKRLTVASMKKVAPPFKIVVTGAHFDENIRVYIHGWQWPLVKWVSSQKIVLTGNKSLKSSVPKDTLTEFRFDNPDGESLTVWWQWP